jgi:hypothetical protein
MTRARQRLGKRLQVRGRWEASKGGTRLQRLGKCSEAMAAMLVSSDGLETRGTGEEDNLWIGCWGHKAAAVHARI